MSTDILADDYDAAEDWRRLRTAAEDRHQQEQLAANAKPAGGSARGAALAAGLEWTFNLPKNIAIGAFDAAVATVSAVGDVAEAADEAGDQLIPDGSLEGAFGADPNATPEQRRLRSQGRDEFREIVSPAVRAFRDEWARSSSTADEVTQGIAQFAVPFMGWAKVLGGLKGATKMGTVGRIGAAEAGAVATGFEGDAPRVADLAALGQRLEGRLGEVMLAATPDGSLLNAYIDYMTDRENEGRAKGRLKNVVDSLVSSAAVAGVFKAGAFSLKAAQKLPGYVAQNAGVGPVGAAAQAGQIRVAAPKFTATHAAENGEHVTAIAGVGEALAFENGKFLQMKRIDVVPEHRGQGAGLRLVEELIDQARARGLTYASDVSVSAEAARIYKSLKRRGYEVKQNPSRVNPNTGNLISEDPRVPVFEVTMPEKQ